LGFYSAPLDIRLQICRARVQDQVVLILGKSLLPQRLGPVREILAASEH